MHILQFLVTSVLLSPAHFSLAATSWSFSDATLTVQSKGAGIGTGLKERLIPATPLPKAISLSYKDTLKIALTTTEGKSAKRPHQAFFIVAEPDSGLEESFPFTVKENGIAKVEISQKDLPVQLLLSTSPLRASIVIASFGSSQPYHAVAFVLTAAMDPGNTTPGHPSPTRYRALEEIHHIFRTDPRSPPKLITFLFTAAVMIALPMVFGVWLSLGGNINHLGKATRAAPASHALFFGSIIAMEMTLFAYYTSWNLFQTLPVAGTIGLVIFMSGSRALSEVQGRRLAGMR